MKYAQKSITWMGWIFAQEFNYRKTIQTRCQAKKSAHQTRDSDICARDAWRPARSFPPADAFKLEVENSFKIFWLIL